ncbi:chorismate mutase [Alkaliphilus pronyensis]|uniref:Shikimate kinase n=1 Tax=Alkaliphilus pronyensis TaxID=1482732 RepID=A0A6I0EWA3_9FIRM|nr:chorismate mutase [Alkaliphilus pronyensis]KAB3529234.1 chorismate mutase [Alkaliphilus pronyensis]
MKNLYELRRDIDECDKELVRLLLKRFDIVKEVAKFKKENNLEILHQNREEEVLKRVIKSSDETEYKDLLVEIYREIMKISRRLQSKLLFSKNIILIGFMGSGKTTIGRELSKTMELPYRDIDNLIEEKEQFSISEIFHKYGEEHFRALERKMVHEVCSYKSTIISCGGGVVLDYNNIVELKKDGIVVLLEASEESIYSRVKNSTNRPLLSNMNLDTIRKNSR